MSKRRQSKRERRVGALYGSGHPYPLAFRMRVIDEVLTGLIVGEIRIAESATSEELSQNVSLRSGKRLALGRELGDDHWNSQV